MLKVNIKSNTITSMLFYKYSIDYCAKLKILKVIVLTKRKKNYAWRIVDFILSGNFLICKKIV